ncbi:MAG TPA: class D sortase [Terriglobales bacterium]|jgi:sortase A|nr:class D sortase [Terriglobales bacterium]
MRIETRRRIERGFLVIGILCLAIYAVAWLHGSLGSNIAEWRFALASTPVAGSRHFAFRGDLADYSLWSEKRVAAYKQTLAMQFDPPLAMLRLPKLRLQVPVFNGTGELILNRGAGRIEGTAMPGGVGNLGIAAHRDGFFRSLKDVEVGDRLELATVDGIITYAIDDIEIVFPNNVSVLQPRPRPSVTLVTCYPFYFIGDAPQRFIVHASQIRDDRIPASSTAAVQTVSGSEVAR